jgi:hypothetical protein
MASDREEWEGAFIPSVAEHDTMTSGSAQVVISGHTCLDVIPTFLPGCSGPDSLIAPGGLTTVGPAVMSTGGAVSNTGQGVAPPLRCGRQVHAQYRR